jgi:hypothetical protein
LVTARLVLYGIRKRSFMKRISYRLGLVAFGLGVVVAGCRSPDASVGSVGEALLQDAVHNGGRPGFYFLPPLVEAVALPPTFDPDLTLVARLDGPGVSVDFALAADPASQHYAGMMDTSGLGLIDGTSYRLHVLAGPVELGFADVLVFEKQAQARSLATDETFELVDGKKLKVKVYVNRCGAVSCAATACRGAGTCDPLDGTCALGPPVVDGTTCPDGDSCNGDELCTAGTCGEGLPIVCDDGDACTTDTCAPESGSCGTAPIANCCNEAADCADDDHCTIDSCSGPGGTCSNDPAIVALWDCAVWDAPDTFWTE